MHSARNLFSITIRVRPLKWSILLYFFWAKRRIRKSFTTNSKLLAQLTKLNKYNEQSLIIKLYFVLWPFYLFLIILQLKFTETCVCDFESIQQLIASENCIAITHKTIQHYVSGGKIDFRFIIKQIKDNDDNHSEKSGEAEHNSRYGKGVQTKSYPTPKRKPTNKFM